MRNCALVYVNVLVLSAIPLVRMIQQSLIAICNTNLFEGLFKALI
jgi:hypothetical protein